MELKALLYSNELKINDKISIQIPYVRDIINDIDGYYHLVSLVVATPIDMMVQLDDLGIDFTTISEWELFCMLFNELKNKDHSIIFGTLNLKDYDIALNSETGGVVIKNKFTNDIIDRVTYARMANALRKILNIEKNIKRPGNEEAKNYMLEKERRKLKSAKRKKQERTQLENQIIALVNSSEFHYDFESVLGLTIYQFNASYTQVINRVNFDKLMIGVYAATVKTENLDQNKLTWIPS